MSKYKESTLKTYANKLERKFKNDCYFVVAIPNSDSELLIGASVIFDNQGIRNKYYIDCWLLEDGNIRIEVFKNDARLKNVYYSVEVLSLNYAIDYIYEYIKNDNEETASTLESATDNEETASNSESEKHYDDYTSEDFIESGIAKECTVCPDFCEDSIENAECAKGNDVFEGCETVKDQYFDTDCLHPNKTIIAIIEILIIGQYFDTDCLHPNKTIIAKIEILIIGQIKTHALLSHLLYIAIITISHIVV
jgi:hypothetical protein